MTAQTTPLKTCFISATLQTDTSKLRQALEQRRVTWTDAASVAVAGTSRTQSVYNAIQSSDFVCAVISAGYETTFVTYEMGMAVGFQKPLLIFVAPDVKLPSDFEQFAYSRTDLQDSEPINFVLDIFLAHAQPKLAQTFLAEGQAPTSHDMKWAWDSVIAMKQEAPKLGFLKEEEFIVEIVVPLFEAAGALTVNSPASDFRGVDLAVWFDALQGNFGNPILVECKTGKITEAELAQAENQLVGFFARTQAQAGLVIYSDTNGKQFAPTSKISPLILRFSIEELIEGVESGDFASFLLAKRNQLLHGRSLTHAAR